MIIYIHGFGGSGEGSKAKAFRKYFESIGETFIAPSLSYVPELAIKTLEELINSYKGEVYLIGSSLGGYYTTYLAKKMYVKRAVLINPSVHPTETLSRAIGHAPNFYDESCYSWNETHLEMLKKYEKNIDAYKHKLMILLQKGDELLDYREAEEKYEGCQIVVEEGGNHGFEGVERHFESIREFFGVGDHFKHTSTVKGIGFDNRELAKRVGDLYYDDLAFFLEELSKKIKLDANADRERGRRKLADALDTCASHIAQSLEPMEQAWRVCEAPTYRWMVKNGFNKDIKITDLEYVPKDILEAYIGDKLTLPEHIIQNVVRDYKQKWQECLDTPHLVGIWSDVYRCHGSIAHDLYYKYQEYDVECEPYGEEDSDVGKIVYGLMPRRGDYEG